MIPYGRQNISESDVQTVIKVLTSDFLTQGPQVPAFEDRLCKYTGATYGVAVNSATSALHLACLALGVGSGDRVWTSPITFVASANCARYCGADVDFVDIDPQTYNLSATKLASKLTKAEQEGLLPKVIIPVHLGGQPCDMATIKGLADRYGIKVIEDASHAIGGQYQNKPIGSGEFSDITVFSFHPVKIITTAEGGVALTNNPVLAQKMALLRSHGVTRDPGLMVGESDGPWYYQQIDLGFNYRMTELQAALGLSQMDRLDQFVSVRHNLARSYDQMLAGLPLTVPYQAAEGYSGLHLYIIRLCLEDISLTHRQVFEALREAGVGVNLHYIPVHTQPYYRDLGFKDEDFPEAMLYYREAISLPMFPDLTGDQLVEIVEKLRMILG